MGTSFIFIVLYIMPDKSIFIMNSIIISTVPLIQTETVSVSCDGNKITDVWTYK